MIDTDTLKRMKFIEPLHRNGKVQCYQIGWNDAVDSIIENAPTIEAEPIKHGRWIPCIKTGMPLTEYGRCQGEKWFGYKCSECNAIYKGNALTESPYCQRCGAKMDLTE